MKEAIILQNLQNKLKKYFVNLILRVDYVAMEIQKLTLLDVARLTNELRGLSGARIVGAAADDSRRQIYISLSNPDMVLKLMVERRFAYIGRAGTIPLSPARVFPLLDGYVIAGCEQVNLDRILKMELEKRDRLGRAKCLYLVFEIIPNRGNLFIVDKNNSVLGTLKEKDNAEYAPPDPLKKASVLNIRDEALIAIAESGGDLSKEVFGLNPRDVKNIEAALGKNSGDAPDILRDYVRKAVKPGPAWKIIVDGSTAGYSLVEPVLSDGEICQRFESALSLYEDYYQTALPREEIQSGSGWLLRILEAEIEKTAKKLLAIENDLADSESAMIFKRYGELILANIDSIERGARTVKLKNLESSGPRYYEIGLDPAKSVSVNAANYFKKYKKAVLSRKSLQKRLDETKERFRSLEELRATDVNDEESLLKGLQRLRLVRPESGRSVRKVQPRRKPYRRFIASCGWEILVGKSNADNDELSLKIAARDDYWFHAWQAAGSHVVLRLPNKTAVPDKQTLLEAAALAAHFSKARGSSKAAVIYTQAKYVRKPRKFAPGKVLVEREKQLMVVPADPKAFGAEDDQ